MYIIRILLGSKTSSESFKPNEYDFEIVWNPVDTAESKPLKPATQKCSSALLSILHIRSISSGY